MEREGLLRRRADGLIAEAELLNFHRFGPSTCCRRVATALNVSTSHAYDGMNPARVDQHQVHTLPASEYIPALDFTQVPQSPPAYRSPKSRASHRRQ